MKVESIWCGSKMNVGAFHLGAGCSYYIIVKCVCVCVCVCVCANQVKYNNDPCVGLDICQIQLKASYFLVLNKSLPCTLVAPPHSEA